MSAHASMPAVTAELFSADPQSRPSRRWTVGTLCRAIADALEVRFNPVEVSGEISGFNRVASGHCYFALKDEAGQIRCAMFRRAAGLLDFQPRDGERVVARGRLSVYEPRGDLQLVVENLSRVGAGTLFEQFLRLKARLEAEGLFDPMRKRQLPTLPQGIAVVTSTGGAAIHDVVTALRRRAPHVPVVVVPAQVQGPSAAGELVQALGKAARLATGTADRAPVEVILLVRGGGALEDLMAFNDESVARAIARSPVPVISGVGHETDFTIADFVADRRAPTPTAAAEFAAEPAAVLVDNLDALRKKLSRAVTDRLERHAQTMDHLAYRVARPSALVVRQRVGLAEGGRRLGLAVGMALDARGMRLRHHADAYPRHLRDLLNKRRQQLEHLAVQLELMGPAQVLARGYVWVSNAVGEAVTSAQGVRQGDLLNLQFADGQLVARAQELHPKKKGR